MLYIGKEISVSARIFVPKALLLFAPALLFALLWPERDALALSAEWQALRERERVLVRLAPEEGPAGEVRRFGAKDVSIALSSVPEDFNLSAPPAALLFDGMEKGEEGLFLRLKTDAFGYIATRPGKNMLQVDIFADPLGSRWSGPAGASFAPLLHGPDKNVSGTKTQAPEVRSPPLPATAPKPEPEAVTGPPALPAIAPGAERAGDLARPEPPDSTPPPVGRNSGSAPIPLLNGPEREGTPYNNLPAWPLLEMPETLPLPPPPPPAGDPLSWRRWSKEAGFSGGPAEFLSAFWPLAAAPALAAEAAGETGREAYREVEAPFAYRAKLNVARDPGWVERKIPVILRVPADMPLNSLEAAPPPVAPVPASSSSPGAPEVSAPASPQAPPPLPAAAPAPPAAPASGTPAPPAPAPSSVPPSPPAAPVPAPEASAPVPPPKTVVYVDELGRPVEPPLDPEAANKETDALMGNQDYQGAVNLLGKLVKQQNLSRAQRETALHRLADATFSLYENDLAGHYQEIQDSTTAAINFNTSSSRNAAAYLRLGFLNLKVENSYEAAAYFNLLRRRFPSFNDIPLTYYYWGDYQYKQGNMNEAAEQFNHVVLNYPDHPISRDSAMGLARTYYRMGLFQEAHKIMEFSELRWPSYYLDYPPVLSLFGDVAYRVGDLDKARSSYWLYYNLVPEAEDADIILTRLGDIYMAGKYHNAAIQAYTEAVNRFPSRDGGIISLMRLAEDGIYDNPTLTGMYKVFDRPYDRRAAEAYRTIIREYPENPLIYLAKLKLAMWNMWQKDYINCIDLCSEIVSAVPNSPLVPRAREVALGAFTLLSAEDVNDKRYSRAREVWQRYPILRTQEEFLVPESRLALAVSQWNSGFMDEALLTLQPFFYGGKIGEISELAMYLALDILTEHLRWGDIVELAQRIELWELSVPAKAQLDYSLALAYENRENPEAAAPIWGSLYERKVLPPAQQANVAFYFGRSAKLNRDLESAYYVGLDALNLLRDLAAANPDQADNEKIKTQIISLMDIAEDAGQLQQAMDYARQYLQYVGEDSAEGQATLYRLSRLYKKRGDTADWLRALENLSEKYPGSTYGRMAASELAGYRLDNQAARFSQGI